MTSERVGKGLGRGYAPLYVAGLCGVAYILLMRLFAGPSPALRQRMTEASRLMARATAAVRDCRAGRGIVVDPAADPNGTGLIGVETSSITTSLGRLEAKRTATNPNFAGLLVRLLDEAGVRQGDAVAVGASSSFPSLIIAAVCALEVIEAEPLVISSLGSSSWGANIPEFHWGDMEDCLRSAGIVDFRPVAGAVGGEEDVGQDMAPAGRALLDSFFRGRGLPFLEEPALERNVAARLRLYQDAAAGRPIRAFVNIGGSTANIGASAEVLRLQPGLIRRVFLPPAAGRGVLQAMAAAGVPVIHLLNVRGLCERYGLPWDPRPLPAPGPEGLPLKAAGRTAIAAWLSAAYILTILVLISVKRYPD